MEILHQDKEQMKSQLAGQVQALPMFVSPHQIPVEVERKNVFLSQ